MPGLFKECLNSDAYNSKNAKGHYAKFLSTPDLLIVLSTPNIHEIFQEMCVREYQYRLRRPVSLSSFYAHEKRSFFSWKIVYDDFLFDFCHFPHITNTTTREF